MDRGHKVIFLQSKHTDGKQTYKKMLSITNQGNANLNPNEIPPHTIQNGYYQKANKYHVLIRM